MMIVKGNLRKRLFPHKNIFALNDTCMMLLVVTLLTMAVTIVSTRSAAQIVINEIYYDHPGSDTGHEFVELLNTGGEEKNLNGFRIEFIDGRTCNTELYYEFIEDLYLASGGILFVGGVDCIPVPNYIAKCGLQNGPDAVRLIYNGSIVDLVGYGDLDFSNLYESKPAFDVVGGYSLARKPDGKDSGNNSLDFVSSLPTPAKKNFFDIDLELSIISDELFPCRNGWINLELEVNNRGLGEFTGPVHIVVVPSIEGEEKIYITGSNDDPLKSGDSISFECDYSASGFIDSMSVFAFLEENTDENSGNDTAFVFFLFSPANLVINEIMYRPFIGNSEWIELYNVGDNMLDLQGWSLSDANRTERLISNERLVLPPGGYLLLAQFPEDMAGIISDGKPKIHGVEGGWPTLNDYSTAYCEEIILRDRIGRVAEKIEYRDIIEEERGRSIERFSPYVCSSIDGGLWHRCSIEAGETPGRVNSAFNGILSISDKFKVLPNPFSPERDGKVVISGKARSRDTGFLVRIFSIKGMEVICLTGEKNGANYFSSSWDGIDSKGRMVVTGLYICVVEYYGLGGSVCRVEKGCLAVKGRG